MEFGKEQLLAYMRHHRLAVVSSISAKGEPQSALIGIAVSPLCEVIFDTVTDSRKHSNLLRNSRAAIVFSGPGEQTLQFEGVARSMAIAAAQDAELLSIYYEAWPDGRDRLKWPNIAYWCVAPRWARYSDFDRGPLIREFQW
jgi:general stress protein 26